MPPAPPHVPSRRALRLPSYLAPLSNGVLVAGGLFDRPPVGLDEGALDQMRDIVRQDVVQARCQPTLPGVMKTKVGKDIRMSASDEETGRGGVQVRFPPLATSSDNGMLQILALLLVLLPDQTRQQQKMSSPRRNRPSEKL